MKKIILAAGVMLAMAFSCFAANPESDFEYDLVPKAEVKLLAQQFKELNPNEDYIDITWYNGDDYAKLIEIPEEIEGCKVIKISHMGIPTKTEKIIVPASVVYIKEFTRSVPTIEFLRAKDSPFAWAGDVRMESMTELPTDRKIIFVNTNNIAKIYLPAMESFTWPKNWTCMYYGKSGDDYLEGWAKQGDKVLRNMKREFYAFPELNIDSGYNKSEVIFEEGIEEIPVRLLETCIKIVLPKSMKNVRNINDSYGFLIEFVSDVKGNIVIPEGAKINFMPGCISGPLSISAKKALQAQGYNVD